MSRSIANPLPAHSSVIRWTVQDVANWLSMNKLKESVSNCRLAGVDGNKLLSCTESDLQGICCPEREIKVIMDQINKMNMPNPWDKKKSPGLGYTRSIGYNKPIAPPVDPDDSGSDGDWSSSEFDEDEDAAPPPPRGRAQLPPRNHNHAPPGPSKPLPAIPPPEVPEETLDDDYMDPEPNPPVRRPHPPILSQPSEELYEDPDNQIKVQHIHAGPLPSLPGNKPHINSARSPSNVKKKFLPPPSRQEESESSDSDDDAEFYAAVDETAPAPAPSSNPKPAAFKARPPTPPTTEQDVYEDPDAPSSQPISATKSKGPKKKPATPPEHTNQEVYDVPDQENSFSPQTTNVKPKRPTAKLPPTPQEQLDYEEPDEKSQAPQLPPPRNAPRNKARPLPQPQEEVTEEDYEKPRPGTSPRRQVPPEQQQEVYEVPDSTPQPPVLPPPLKKHENLNTKASKKQETPAQGVEETYEVPDLPKNPPPTKSWPPTPVVKKEEPVPVLPAQRNPMHTRGLPPTPVDKKVNYTQVEVKYDKGPCVEAPGAATSPGNIDLENQRWFYGNTSRQEVQQRLEHLRKNGMYVIRNSTKGPNEPYTLQVFYENKVYNLSIRKRSDQKFAIGTVKPDETAFSTLLELINFFKQNYLVLQGGLQAKLKSSLPRE